jgi:tRNA(Ile)-lysidine synthase
VRGLGQGPGPALPLTRDEAAALLIPVLDQPGGAVLAVSGGPDSVSLMRFAAAIARDPGAILVATVDHGLRPGSRAECDAVAAWAGACGLRHAILTWDAAKPRTRVQEAAREARYALLAAAARAAGATQVVTAHTLDDQAETVLMRLAAGTGIGGLAAMRPSVERQGVTIARPFLAVRKARLVAACEAQGWPFHDDPSNADPRFARARLRHIAPMLEAEGLTPERLAALAERAHRAEEALDLRAEQVLAAARRDAAGPAMEFDGSRLAAEPDAILVRAVALAIAATLGPAMRPVRLERFEARVLGDLRAALEGGRRLRLTLAGALIEARPDRRVLVGPEPERRRGRR